MGQVGGLPSSLLFKVGWLAAAFVVVWVNSPTDRVQGRPDGLAAGVPAVAAAATIAGVDDASAGAVDGLAGGVAGPPTAAGGSWVEVGLVRGAAVEDEGIRLGVLAAVDDPIPASIAREPGERHIWAYVALRNVGEREITYTALDLELSDGRSVYSSVEGRRGPGPHLAFGALAPGEGISGWRLFRVPASAGPFRLVYSGPSAF
jgi:hypothetical protein